ncbi:S8 family serine peptidase [Candidatus Berkelbacteria bacterium]|nr:S8 family serine peptidase [Candidatus Berkelbacteria bacterium]
MRGDMKLKNKILIPVLIIGIALLGYVIYLQGGFSAESEQTILRGKPIKEQRQIMVKYSPETSKSKKLSIEKKYKVTLRKELSEIKTRVYNIPANSNPTALISALSRETGIEYVEQDSLVSAADINPNDPIYANRQHSLYKQVLVNRVWDITTGDPNVIIAILDTGILSSHKELQGRLVSGYSAVGGNTEPVHYHGTAVAGYAAANTNNNSMIASGCWECKIMPIRVTDESNGWAYESDIADGLIWASNHGARVANVSYSPLDSSTLLNAAKYFYDRNGLVVSSAGNDNTDTGLSDTPYLITTSATSAGESRSDGTVSSIKANYSSYGRNVDVAAPGGDATLYIDGEITYSLTGTSLSTPRVAGLIALIMSYDPTLSQSEIENIIKKSAEDYGDAGWDPIFGFGEIDAEQAFIILGQTPIGDSTPPTVQIVSPTAGSTVGSSRVSVKAIIKDNSGAFNLPTLRKSDGTIAKIISVNKVTGEYIWDLFLTNGSNGAPLPTSTYKIEAKDFRLNSTFTDVVINYVKSSDSTAPTVSVTTPLSDATISGIVKVSASATDNVGVSTVIFTAGSSYIGEVSTAPYEFNWNTETIDNSTYDISAIAYDSSGNFNIGKSYRVVVKNSSTSSTDTTPPTISLSSPTNGSTVSGTLSISVNASDNVGIKEVYTVLDGTNLGTDTSSPYSFSYDTKQKPNGTYSLQATAIDTSGNISSTTISVTISNTLDIQAPTITITSPANNSTLPKSPNVKVTSTYSDNTGVVRVDLYVDNAFYVSSYSEPFTISWNTKKLTRGTHTIQLKAYDAAGNVGTSQTVTVIK